MVCDNLCRDNQQKPHVMKLPWLRHEESQMLTEHYSTGVLALDQRNSCRPVTPKITHENAETKKKCASSVTGCPQDQHTTYRKHWLSTSPQQRCCRYFRSLDHARQGQAHRTQTALLCWCLSIFFLSLCKYPNVYKELINLSLNGRGYCLTTFVLYWV